MSTTILEGVDNEVLLAFVVLIAVGVFTIFYYFSTSGQSSYNLLNGWQYLRNFFEREFVEDTRSEERESADRTSSDNNDSRNVQDRVINNQDRQATSQTENVHDSQRINSNFAGPSSSQTEGSHEEGQSCRPRTGGLGTSQDIPNSSTTETRSTPGQLSLRVKHHEVERNYIVGANTTVGELKRLSFPREVAQGRRVRLIYSGRLLHDDSASLSFYGVSNFSVIHAQISDGPQPNASQQGLRDDEIELDISRLFIPLLTFILCGCWYGLISYGQLFNTTSTVILVIVTAAYAFMVYVMLG